MADEATLAAVRETAETMLSNPVIEDVVSVRVLEGTEEGAQR